MKEGLKPKSQNAVYEYPDRVHLMKGNIPTNALFSLGRQLFVRNQDKNNNGKYVLLAIDTSLIPNTTEIFYDPRFEGGYYLKESVPPEAISPLFGYDFTTNKKFNV